MAYVFFNPNPDGKLVDDCVIRALSIVLDMDWEEVHAKLSVISLMYHDMMNSNYVWERMLDEYGFRRHIIPNTCPSCYTVRQFASDNPEGVYLLATGQHVVAVINGDYYDTFDSGDYVPIYYWQKEVFQPVKIN